MPRKQSFTNLNQINKALTGNSMATSSALISKQLQEAGAELKRIVEKHIRAYYDSYNPSSDGILYQRTYALLNSVRLDRVQQGNGTMSIRVYIDPVTATHSSVLGGEAGYTGTLIDVGWSWHNQPNPPINHFSQYEGYGFMKKSIDEFNKINKWGFTITQNVR